MKPLTETYQPQGEVKVPCEIPHLQTGVFTIPYPILLNKAEMEFLYELLKYDSLTDKDYYDNTRWELHDKLLGLFSLFLNDEICSK